MFEAILTLSPTQNIRRESPVITRKSPVIRHFILIVALSFKAVTDPAECLNIVWIRGVFFNLQTQVSYMDIDRSSIPIVFIPPNSFQQLFPRIYSSWVSH